MKHFPRRVKRNFSGKVSIRNLSRGEELSESRDFAFFTERWLSKRQKEKRNRHEEEAEEESKKRTQVSVRIVAAVRELVLFVQVRR